MRHWDALLPGRVLHVPYEQLVGDQEALKIILTMVPDMHCWPE